jgi:hypothetical protein
MAGLRVLPARTFSKIRLFAIRSRLKLFLLYMPKWAKQNRGRFSCDYQETHGIFALGLSLSMPISSLPNFRIFRIDWAAHGPFWIAIGMLWIGVAQFMSGWPIATAVAVIGYGALEHRMRTRTRRRSPHGYRTPDGMVCLLNLLVYVALIGLAIAAQWDLALRSPAGQLGPLIAMDHLLAMLCMFCLIRQTANRLSAESA